MTLHDDALMTLSNLGTGSGGGASGSGFSTELALKNCFRMVILGAPRVGKTCIVNWFLGKAFRDVYCPTIEDFHRKIYKIRGEIYRLDILDTSGNDPYPAGQRLNIMTGDIFIVVFSLDSIDSFLQAKTLCQQVIQLKRSSNTSASSSKQNSGINVPILLMGNKLDYLLDAKITSRCVEQSQLQQFTQSFKSCMVYAEASCKSAIGMESAFEKLFVQSNLPCEMVPSRHRRVSLNLDLTKPQFTNVSKSSLPAEQQSALSSPTKLGSIKRKAGPGVSFKDNRLLPPPSATELSSTSSTSMLTAAAAAATATCDGRAPLDHESSLRFKARKSFRAMTFRRHITDACGAVWLNARRPSIRAELSLLEAKSKHGGAGKSNKSAGTGLMEKELSPSVIGGFLKGVRKLFMCHNSMG